MRPILPALSRVSYHYSKQGESTRFIAERCDVIKTKVQELRQEHFHKLPVPKRGRPQKLSHQNKRLCVRAITSENLKTAINVVKMLRKDIQTNVNHTMVAPALKEVGPISNDA
jgi:transposase